MYEKIYGRISLERYDVAAVGGKLYYADNSIQHAGIVIGLGAHRAAGHTHYKDDKMHLGYMGRLCYAQDVTAVTGACLLVGKEQNEEVGGNVRSLAQKVWGLSTCVA